MRFTTRLAAIPTAQEIVLSRRIRDCPNRWRGGADARKKSTIAAIIDWSIWGNYSSSVRVKRLLRVGAWTH
jgi:hypothetical protein